MPLPLRSWQRAGGGDGGGGGGSDDDEDDDQSMVLKPICLPSNPSAIPHIQGSVRLGN